MNASTEEVSISPDGAAWTLPGTLVLPVHAAPAPCVIFFAGSGPTDRNWLSPLLPRGRGSAELLAEGLRVKGVGSLRFDKVGSGTNMKPLDVLSLAHYVDEARAAFEFLTARPADCASITLAGHSEGSLHMLSAAVALQDEDRFAGYASMAGTSRSILDAAIEQIRDARIKQGADPAVIESALTSFRVAMSDPGSPAPDFAAIPGASALWAAARDPRQARAVRELLGADPLQGASRYRGRALVLTAEHDLQVPRFDADRLFAALGSPPGGKIEVAIANANHVFRLEPESPSAIDPAAAVQGYTDPARPLADGVVDALAAFAKSAG
jgi:fermentation-respiration switch protein FrsA (DUF1100 family)